MPTRHWPTKPGTPLTRQEWICLWLISQGKVWPAVAHGAGITRNAAEQSGRRIRARLEVHNMAQAVHVAMSRGIIGQYRDCGTDEARLRHISRREPLCARCSRFRL
jgi:DNA-binding CsgD family transcriptional regulator